MNNLDVLTTARATISHPENWTKFVRREPTRSGGFAYCALGVLDHVLGQPCDRDCKLHPSIELLALSLTPEQIRKTKTFLGTSGGWPKNALVAQFNNSHSHAEILALFDRAIERQRGIEAMKVAPVEAESVA